MSKSNFEPLQELVALREKMNKLFEDNFVVNKSFDTVSWSPVIDIFEGPEQIIIQAELPGLLEKEVSLKVEEKTVIISGKRDFEDPGVMKLHRMEQRYGAFKRRLDFESRINPLIQKTFNNGLLEIILKKEK